jgi:hypothetical protein
MILLNSAGNTEPAYATPPPPPTAWNTIAQSKDVSNIAFGLTSTGQVGRVYYSSGWVTNVGSDLGNSNTGYTSVATEWNYTAGRAMYSSGGGNGLDFTRFSGTWGVENASTANYDLLATVLGPSTAGDYAVYGANSSGLDFVYKSGTWQTTNINSNVYTALATDLDQSYVLFGLTSTGVDKISSTDSGATWTTTQILSGNYTGIADNVGVADAVYLIPEPSTVALLLSGLGLVGLLRRRR